MKLKESNYYNIEFLGKYLYEKIKNRKEIFTVHEYFGINNSQKEYHKKGTFENYKLKVCEDYYEFECFQYYESLLLVFDKPVHVTGKYCANIFAPEIIIKSRENNLLSYCIANKAIIDNSCEHLYFIDFSKINSVYFYNNEVSFKDSEINNFFIFNKDLKLYRFSEFLEGIKIKCFGACGNLKNKMSYNEDFKNGIIHIE